MQKYWKIKSRRVIGLMEKYNQEFKEATGRVLDAVLKLPDSNLMDTENIGVHISVSGATHVSIKFKIAPDLKYWKVINHPFYLPKSVNPFYKEFNSIASSFPEWLVEYWIGMTVVQPDGSFCRAGLHKLGNEFYVITDETFKGNSKVQRISDLQFEALKHQKSR